MYNLVLFVSLAWQSSAHSLAKKYTQPARDNTGVTVTGMELAMLATVLDCPLQDETLNCQRCCAHAVADAHQKLNKPLTFEL
jgi:mannose/fructose-specific phosphotransferase system component IIA